MAGQVDALHGTAAHPRLAAIADTLDQTGWAFELFDAEWRLVWVSQGTKAVLDEFDDQRLGCGRHLVEAWASDVRRSRLSPQTQTTTLAEIGGFALYETPGGAAPLRRAMGDRWPPEMDGVTPTPAPDLWAWAIEFIPPGSTAATRVRSLMVRCRDETGAVIGSFFIYSSALPANIFALLVRGDEELFKRTAELVEPHDHATAILFADLESSSQLANRLPAAVYFEVVRELLTGIDALVVAHGGIVGKHGGDGATAFFLADQLNGKSAAARAALAVARAAPAVAERAARVADADLRVEVNIGVHWADRLHVGQVITDGRLEVTALGAEVNQCARLQESARGGALLVSKALLDRLDADDRRALGIPEPDAFTLLADVFTATPKARRDAGELPVTQL